MNRQLAGVGAPGVNGGLGGSSGPDEARSGADAQLEDQVRQAAAARAAETLQQQQGLLGRLHSAAGTGVFGGGGADAFLSQESLLAAQQQQQQLAALSLASDIRTAALLRQASLGGNDLLLARAAALQEQLGLGGGGGGAPAPGMGDSFQHEFDLQRLQDHRQLLAAAASNQGLGGVQGFGVQGLGGLTPAQQMELQQEAQRQELLGLTQGGNGGAPGDASNLAAVRGGAPSSGVANSAQGAQGGVPVNSPPAVEQAPPRAPTAAEAVAQTKDTFQKTPGSVVVPCRARGMPMDHNFKTAYFVIPENVEHGEELICSYFACRNAGIKFRYCTHCKVPVAKRNFRKRHKHGKATTAGDDDDDDGSDGPAETPSRRSSGTNGSKVAKAAVHVADAMDAHKKSSSRKPDSYGKMPTEVATTNGKSREEPKSPMNNRNGSSDDGQNPPPFSSSDRKISSERQRFWNNLLAKRPPTKDGEAVSQWLMEVLSISDLDTPLGQQAGADGKNRDAVALLAQSTRVQQQRQSSTSSSNSEQENGPGMSSSSSNGGGSALSILKKKRPLPSMLGSLSKSEDDSKKDNANSGGGYAEWKDRKKHKGLPKKSFATAEL
eukprot:CAMPEP_0194027862 /NCGR_PEP_ID=MMETSP0009_2-20130614/1901_1 /TAXON_ID=210454 /ORGANISM="Grammatophora oceanica, Strain CCMP 410" /LENGTH=605 /DNA_ID=CAMNT_0038667041 /DNA_START=88 /DNA_END=1905 /DNA_ORIENTATION=+